MKATQVKKKGLPITTSLSAKFSVPYGIYFYNKIELENQLH